MQLPFDEQCRAVGLPAPEPEVRFHPVRSWRWDWAWTDVKLAVEIQGVGGRTKDGRPTHGRHSRPAGMAEDCTKWFHGLLLGWRVLVCTSRQAGDGTAREWARQILETLKEAR